MNPRPEVSPTDYNALGVEGPGLSDDELVVGAIVLIKVLGTDGTVGLLEHWTPGLDWLSRLGMLEAARAATRDTGFDDDDDGELTI